MPSAISRTSATRSSTSASNSRSRAAWAVNGCRPSNAKSARPRTSRAPSSSASTAYALPPASRWATASASTDSSVSSSPSSPASTTFAASSSATWYRSKSISRARARASPPNVASAASISASLPRAERSGPRSTLPYSSSAARCVDTDSKFWCACCPCRSTASAADLSEQCRRRQATVDIRPGTTLCRNDPTQNGLGAIGCDKTTIDSRFGRAPAEPLRYRLDHRRAVRSRRRASFCRLRFRPSAL